MPLSLSPKETLGCEYPEDGCEYPGQSLNIHVHVGTYMYMQF